MRIEHMGLQVEDPAGAAAWYAQHLGFEVKRSGDEPVPVRFLADESGRIMLELYRNPAVPLPDYRSADPLVMHVAFVCADVPATVRRLLAAGATLTAGPQNLPNGDEIAMLRDPWGLPIQLCRRGEPMV